MPLHNFYKRLAGLVGLDNARLRARALQLQEELDRLHAKEAGVPFAEFQRRKQLDSQAARTLAVRAALRRSASCPSCAAGIKHRHSDSE